MPGKGLKMNDFENFKENFLMAVDFENPPALDENTKISHLEKFDSIAVLGTMVMFEIEYEKTVTAEEVMSCETLKDLFLLSVDN